MRGASCARCQLHAELPICDLRLEPGNADNAYFAEFELGLPTRPAGFQLGLSFVAAGFRLGLSFVVSKSCEEKVVKHCVFVESMSSSTAKRGSINFVAMAATKTVEELRAIFERLQKPRSPFDTPPRSPFDTPTVSPALTRCSTPEVWPEWFPRAPAPIQQQFYQHTPTGRAPLNFTGSAPPNPTGSTPPNPNPTASTPANPVKTAKNNAKKKKKERSARRKGEPTRTERRAARFQ